MSTLLVVDDEQSICWGLARLGESLGHVVAVASSAEQGLAEATQRQPDVVILDVRLPGMDGLTAIERFQDCCGAVPIIIITAFGDLRIAVEAIRRGAFDYIAKPFDLAKVKGALVRALTSQPGGVTGEVAEIALRVEGMVGRSPIMQEVYKKLALAASSDASTLITGESGTGKELAARAIHRYSARGNGPFVAVNVASLSSTLAESELFGHERGSFTGAESARVGLLAQADGGTLFLDEVADIPVQTQVKLLRALEHGEVTPVGGMSPVHTDFRVVSATHRDLARLVSEGEFRHDLFFRLCAFQIDLPPLRERSQDIVHLAECFIDTLANPPATPRVALTPQARAELERRHWHGNVRELHNAIAHALIMARGCAIMPDHLPDELAFSTDGESDHDVDQRVISVVRGWVEQHLNDTRFTGRLYERLLEVVEPPLLAAALERHNGQCATAARMLGIHRTTLRKKLDEHGLEGDGVNGE